MRTTILALLGLMIGAAAQPVAAASIAFDAAFATYDQDQLNGAQMIDGIADIAVNGWAIFHPELEANGQDPTLSERALLRLAAPLSGTTRDLELTIYQSYPVHHLGHFALGYTGAADPGFASAYLPLSITSIRATFGSVPQLLAVNEVVVGGPLPTVEVLRVRFTLDAATPMSAIFLDVINAPGFDLFTDGPGRYFNGNFVVSEVTLADFEAVVPLPAALPLLGAGLLSLACWAGQARRRG